MSGIFCESHVIYHIYKHLAQSWVIQAQPVASVGAAVNMLLNIIFGITHRQTLSGHVSKSKKHETLQGFSKCVGVCFYSSFQGSFLLFNLMIWVVLSIPLLSSYNLVC